MIQSTEVRVSGASSEDKLTLAGIGLGLDQVLNWLRMAGADRGVGPLRVAYGLVEQFRDVAFSATDAKVEVIVHEAPKEGP